MTCTLIDHQHIVQLTRVSNKSTTEYNIHRYITIQV